MTTGPGEPRAVELLRRWRGLVVSVEAPERATARRERMIGRVGGFIRQASIQRRRQRVRRRVAFAVAIAASAWLGIGLLSGSAADPVAPLPTEPSMPAVQVRQAALQQASDGTVVARTGEEGAELVRSASPAALQPGDQVSTAADGMAQLELAGQARVHLGRATRLRIVETRLSEQRLLLQSGRIDVTIPKQAPQQQLAIETPDAEVHVIGTIFSVELTRVSDSGGVATVVDVSRGEVRVIRRCGGKVESLQAGTRWVSSDEVAGIPACGGELPRGRAGVDRASSESTTARALVSQSDLALQNRAYQAALDARNAGDDDRALRLLEQFLLRYPTSPLAQEAKVERFRILRRMGRDDEAARQARRYLAEHDAGYARDEARELILKPSAERPQE